MNPCACIEPWKVIKAVSNSCFTCAGRDSIDSLTEDFSCQPEIVSTLFRAITKGVLFAFRIEITSAVCGLIPSFISTTKIAKSASEPPLFRKFVKAACPGVSINRNPGIVKSVFVFSINGQDSKICSNGYFVNEIF